MLHSFYLKSAFPVLRAAALVLLAVVTPGLSLADTRLSEDEMQSFLVQCIWSGATGEAVFPTASHPRCRPHLQQMDDLVEWRKHDWPGTNDPSSWTRGYLASDAVIQHTSNRSFIVHTADFGDAVRRFGHFDQGRGDGGQVLLIVDRAAYAIMTEDGGAGLQWFIGEHCRRDQTSDERFKSWLFFRDDVLHGKWTEITARLNITRSSTVCPPHLNSALTRYRREVVAVPFRVINDNQHTAETHQLDVIVSEHFGRDRINTADHLERFFFARGLGMIRWERWEHPERTLLKNVRQQARIFAETGRCPPLAFSDPPSREWVMTDCRTWTALIKQNRPWSVRQYGWPNDLVTKAQ